MPIPGGGKYRYKKGTSVRLHFTPEGDVNEAKNMDTGATHTPDEFAADKRKAQPRMKPLSFKKNPAGITGY